MSTYSEKSSVLDSFETPHVADLARDRINAAKECLDFGNKRSAEYFLSDARKYVDCLSAANKFKSLSEELSKQIDELYSEVSKLKDQE